ncbi:MAG: M20 family metallopeptidase [Lentisphaeria bacterium]|nr:M20 family metallopeptidase [Lentisphaeria bacterium]
MSHIVQQAIADIDKERLVELCRELVRTPTVSPYSGDQNPSGEGAGCTLVANAFRALGAKVELVPCTDIACVEAGVMIPHDRIIEGRPNVVATFTLGAGNGATVLLDAHLDTVAVDAYQGDPFSAELADGFIHGRGSSDDKSSVASMIEAARILANLPGLDGTLVCCAVTDEECDGGGRGSLSCLRHLDRPDVAIVIDGSHDMIYDGCTGCLTAEVIVHGRAGHAALGGTVNAIEQAIRLMPAFDHFRELRGDAPGEFNLGIFQSGDHPANVPNRARLAMNIKTTLDDMDQAETTYGQRNGRIVRELFERCVAEHAQTDAFFCENPPEVRWVKDLPAAARGAEAGTLRETLTEAWTLVHNCAPPFGTLGGWGDMAHFMNAGIPTLGMGAGLPGAAHASVEKVAVEDLVDTAKIVAAAVAHLLSE